MTYLKIAIFLAFSLFLFLFPARLYTNRKFRRAWLGMAYSENFRLFTARLLCLVLILFHLVYYALFPLEKGIMLSSIYVFGSPAKPCGLSIDSRKSKQEEFSVYDASELRSELFDFSIERFSGCIGRTVDKIV